MPRALSSVRLDQDATCKYVVFIEGLSRGYTDDSEGAITGSGVGSWVYTSELNAGSREVAGSREIVTGLILPSAVTFGLDMRTGMLQPEPLTIQILDNEAGDLADLFATEGKVTETLAERIAPGVADLGASVATPGAGTTNPRGRYVGIERIGPAGERRFFPALPYDLVGYDHPVHAGAEPPDGLPPVLISDDPVEFAGRMVTLYRIYKNPDAQSDGATAYYRWDEAHTAGDLVWFGIMRDSGRVSGNRVWSIDCHGPDALMRRTLGARNPVVRTRAGADLTLAADESYVAIGFASRGVAGPSVETYYDASIFDHQITATSSRAALATEINGWIESVIDGTDTNVAFAGGDFDTWLDAMGNANPDAGITNEGRVFVRREDQGVHDDATYGVLCLVMHSRAWRKLGFEPETQHRDGVTFDDATHASFRRLIAGEQLTYGQGTGVVVPGDGYIRGIFTTITAGYTPEDIEAYPNGGAPRYWLPYHTSEVFVLDHRGGQVLRLLDEDVGSMYLEGQLTAGWSQFAEINATPTERARWFLLEGEVVEIDDDPTTDEVEVSDATKLAQVCLASWVEGPQYGTVSDGGDVSPALYVERYLDPRGFGLNHAQRQRDWSGKTTGEGEIEVSPLNAYHYLIDNAPFEQAATLLAQILLSTGACAGYDAAIDDGGSITAGPNTHTAAPAFAGDYELADLGLGIPHQIVAHPNTFRDACDTLPGGVNGDMCRLRLAYKGPFAAASTLEAITRPRQLCWSLAGKQIGVFRIGPVSPEDVDIAIDEDDLYGTPGDPASTIPGQDLRATGQVDGVKLSYRWDPGEDSTAETWSLRALDPGASRRTGELIEEVEDHGLCPPWYREGDQQQLTGVSDWRPLFRQLWQRDVPTFYARRHFAARLRLSRPKGQDAMPGSAVMVTNPWLVNPAGGYGVTAAAGRILRATHDLHTGACEIEAIVFAVPGPLHYAPQVLVSGVTGNVVSYYEDHLDHGGDAVDGTGFAEPDWASYGGTGQATVYQRTGDTWAAIVTRGVSSVDTAARTITLDGAVTGYLRDHDHYVVLSAYSVQSAGSYPRELYGTAADDDETIDGTIPASEHIG